MTVIADTTPLISLMKIGQLTLLKELFGKVCIPEAVYRELVINPMFKSEAQEIENCEYIKVVNVTDKRAVRILRKATGLDIGESEAIVLTDEQHGNLILMDEAKGRNVAKMMGIKIMGTIGILMVALEKQLISYTKTVQAIEILKESGRHMKEDLYDALLDAAKKYK